MSVDVDLEQALEASRFSFTMELARRRAEPQDTDLDLALMMSQEAFEEEMKIRSLMPEDTDLELALRVSRQMFEEAPVCNPTKEPIRNNCLAVAFKQLYRIRFGREFTRNVREEIRQIATDRFGRINEAMYEVDDGQQLSVHAFEALMTDYRMRVRYVRKNDKRSFLGDGDLIEGYVVLHTVGEDYGIDGEYKYAGHYEIVPLRALIDS